MECYLWIPAFLQSECCYNLQLPPPPLAVIFTPMHFQSLTTYCELNVQQRSLTLPCLHFYTLTCLCFFCVFFYYFRHYVLSSILYLKWNYASQLLLFSSWLFSSRELPLGFHCACHCHKNSEPPTMCICFHQSQ